MLHAQIDITGMLWIAKGLDFVQCVKVHQDDMETIRCIIQKEIEMNTTFEKSANSTDEWYTPKEIIDALGEFDLDPCAPVSPPI